MTMDLKALLARLIFSVLLTIPSLLLLLRPLPGFVAALSKKKFDRYVFAAYAVLRAGLFVVVFAVLHQPARGDVAGYYPMPAHKVLQGLIPYRDFAMSYAPLFPYLNAALLKLHDTPLTLIGFAIVLDIAALPLWIGVGRRQAGEATVRKAALLLSLQPFALWNIAVDGSNDALIALLLAAGLYLLLRREALSGFLAMLSVPLVKFLPLLFVPSFLGAARQRVRWLLAAASSSIVVYGICVLKGLDITVPVKQEGGFVTPFDLPYLISALTGVSLPKALLDGCVLLGLAAVLAVSLRSQWKAVSDSERMWKLTLSLLPVLSVTLLLAKKSYSTYLCFFFMLICLFVSVSVQRGGRLAVWFYAIVSATFLAGNSYWFYPMHGVTSLQLHGLFLAGDGAAIVMMISQALYVFAYGWLIVAPLRALNATAPLQQGA